MLDTSLGATLFFVKPLLNILLAAAARVRDLTSGLFFGILLVLVSVYLVLWGTGWPNEQNKAEDRIDKPRSPEGLAGEHFWLLYSQSVYAIKEA